MLTDDVVRGYGGQGVGAPARKAAHTWVHARGSPVVLFLLRLIAVGAQPRGGEEKETSLASHVFTSLTRTFENFHCSSSRKLTLVYVLVLKVKMFIMIY
jgi:hypothetical protein